MTEIGSQPPELLGGDTAADEPLSRMTLIGHLEELRRRIIHSLVAVLLGFFVCWFFSKEIYSFLSRPIMAVLPEGEQLVFLGVTDAFFLYVKVAMLAAIFLTSPFILYQLWRFVAPGLYRNERRYSLPFIFFGSTFFLAGGLFAYYVALPFAVDFLINYGLEDFKATITIGRYFSFLLTVILGLALMFELPILIFLFSQIGLVTPRFLLRNFRWAVLIIFIVAAIITPTPDPLNLMLFAVPAVFLYLLGVGAAALASWRKKKPEDD